VRTLLLDSSFSLSFAAVSAGLCPGYTLAANAILSPLGDQSGPSTSIGSFVSWRASPPSIGSSQT